MYGLAVPDPDRDGELVLLARGGVVLVGTRDQVIEAAAQVAGGVAGTARPVRLPDSMGPWMLLDEADGDG